MAAAVGPEAPQQARWPVRLAHEVGWLVDEVLVPCGVGGQDNQCAVAHTGPRPGPRPHMRSRVNHMIIPPTVQQLVRVGRVRAARAPSLPPRCARRSLTRVCGHTVTLHVGIPAAFSNCLAFSAHGHRAVGGLAVGCARAGALRQRSATHGRGGVGDHGTGGRGAGAAAARGQGWVWVDAAQSGRAYGVQAEHQL
jgi:hypothetical protein